ncbi:NAD(P)-dependent alcohol dehydrogenase [Nocardioides dilutus]
MKTTVALVESPGQDFTLAEVELDGPRDDEVLVRVVATGLCHSDVTMSSFLPAEMFPNVFGHEGAGVVEQVGAAVTGIEVGDHVVMSIRSCRACAQCRAGFHGHCEQGLFINYMGMRMDGSTTYTRDGQPVFGSFFGQSSFSQHAIAYADNCVVVDKSLDLARLGPYGCGFQTGVGTMLNVANPAADESVVVYGAGSVGLSAIAAGRTTGAMIVTVDPLASRRELAASYGALVVDPNDLGDLTVVDKVKELTGGGATYGIDTTAVPEVVKAAQQSLAVRGMLIAIGLGAEEYPIDAVDLLHNGKVVRSSVEGDADPLEFIPRMLGMADELDLDRLVTPYPFDRINQAIEDSASGKVVKPVLVW